MSFLHGMAGLSVPLWLIHREDRGEKLQIYIHRGLRLFFFMRTLQSLPLSTGPDIRQVPCRCVGKYKRWKGEDTSPFDNFLSNGLKSSLTKHYELLGVDPRTLLGLQIHEVACNSFLFQGTADIPQSKPQTAYLFVT